MECEATVDRAIRIVRELAPGLPAFKSDPIRPAPPWFDDRQRALKVPRKAYRAVYGLEEMRPREEVVSRDAMIGRLECEIERAKEEGIFTIIWRAHTTRTSLGVAYRITDLALLAWGETISYAWESMCKEAWKKMARAYRDERNKIANR